jgi:hypothetical protein
MLNRWSFLLLWLATHSAFGATFKVTVKVVDTGNRPVPNANVTLMWNIHDGKTGGDKETLTDKEGKVVLQPEDWNEKRPALIFSDDHKLGGVIAVSKDDDGKEVTARLGPTVQLKGKLDCTELKSPPRWANTLVIPDGFRPYFAQYQTESAQFDFVLPVGKYTLNSYGTDVESLKQTITLSTNQTEVDLGTLDLKASPIAKLKGKTAPNWEITAVRGVKRQAKLSDYKGKWVYLEFWGFW